VLQVFAAAAPSDTCREYHGFRLNCQQNVFNKIKDGVALNFKNLPITPSSTERLPIEPIFNP
jgi:hypothetical protein